jgi:hypothetical protein
MFFADKCSAKSSKSLRINCKADWFMYLPMMAMDWNASVMPKLNHRWLFAQRESVLSYQDLAHSSMTISINRAKYSPYG